MEELDLNKIMSAIESSFIPEKAALFSGSFQCHILGSDQGDWVMIVKDKQIKILPGIDPTPRATLELQKEDLVELLSGKLDPLKAFFSGQIQLKGDMPAVMKLIGMFKLHTDSFK